MSVELQPSPAALPTVAVLTDLNEAIEQATQPRDLLNLRERAEVLRRLAKRHEAAELQFEASKAKLICDRRLGDVIRKLIKAALRSSGRSRTGSGCFNGFDKVLPEGISWDQSSTWQRLSRLPEPEFEKWLQEHREAGAELTQKSLLDRANVWIRKEENEQKNKGCGGEDSDDLDEDSDEDDEDDGDEDDGDEDDDDEYPDQMILRPTVAQKREITAALPALQEFFGTDNFTDTIVAMCRQVLHVIQEPE